MNGWKAVLLGTVASIERLVIQPEMIQPGTDYLGLEHVETGGKILNAQKVSEGELASSKFRFTDRHVLYGKLRPYLAKIALPDFSGICSTDILPILPNPSLDRRFLAFFLRQPFMIEHANSRASGANLPRLSPSELAKFEIPLPPLAEQKRIAAILDAADALRIKRRESLALLDTLLQSTFLSMFGDPVTNPMGWEVAEIGDHVKIMGGFAFKSIDFSEKGAPIIRISNLTDELINIENCVRIPLSALGKGERFKLQPGDALIAMSGATTGKLGFVPDNLKEEWFLNQRVGAFRISQNSAIHREYLYAILRSSFYQNHVWNLANGAAQPNISGKQLESVKIPLPPFDLQRRFAAIVEAMEAQKARMRAHLAELDVLFASLQHRAFAGEL